MTTCPPIPIEWGAAWWVRVDDVWVRLRKREIGEHLTPELERELCEMYARTRQGSSTEDAMGAVDQ